jgi:hypothetical protein
MKLPRTRSDWDQLSELATSVSTEEVIYASP